VHRTVGKGKGWVAAVTLSAHHADVRKPCLLITAKKPSDVCLRVILTAPPGVFPPARLLVRPCRYCFILSRSTPVGQ
jgi:hypothetical protein